MKKPSFFGKWLEKSLKEDEGPTSEEIDRDVEDAVTAIKSKQQDVVTATSLIRSAKARDEKNADRIFMMGLTPFFEIFGSREGRLPDRLREECSLVFEQRRKSEHDQGTLERDLFLMRFPAMAPMQGFQHAALIINEIGKAILGDQFEAMDLAGLLTVAKAEDLADADDEFSAKKAAAVVKQGGLPMSFDSPPDAAPNWIKMHWRSHMSRAGKLHQIQGTKKLAPQKRELRPTDQWVKRKQSDRRHAVQPFPGPDRRHAFDRRGRGY